MVQFQDGAIKAQLGLPNMKLPIQYAFAYPYRLPNPDPKPQLDHYMTLTFERPDTSRFPLLEYAYEAMRRGGNMPCIMNAANEIVVEAFLHDRIAFTDMPQLIAPCNEHRFVCIFPYLRRLCRHRYRNATSYPRMDITL